MLVGIFADVHDHVEHLAQAVELFNRRGCDLAVFAGDLVSTFVVPRLRKLQCRFVGVFGDNEGNRVGLLAGIKIVGLLGPGPVCVMLDRDLRLIVAHMASQLRHQVQGCQIVVVAHTHKPSVRRDEQNRLWINPGELSGWTYGDPTLALLDTKQQAVEIHHLNTGRAEHFSYARLPLAG